MKFPLSILITLCALQLSAQDFPGLDTAIQRITKNTPFVGATILVAKGDKIIHNKGYGYAHQDFKVPATDSTRYWVIGNKNITLAALAMKLVEQGKFSLDDKITKHLKGLPAAYEAITVKHLITCTSGIPDYHYLGDRYLALNGISLAQDEALHRVIDLPLTITPGSKFDWSISNFIVLNMIMEKTSGKSYQQLLKEFIAPLGISSTGCFEPHKTVRNLAQGYAFNSLAKAYYPYTPSVFQYEPSGYLYSTPKDLFMMWRGMVNGKLISKSSHELMLSAEEMKKNNSAPFGYLAGVNKVQDQDINAMNGALPGFSGTWHYIPKLDATVIILSNSTGEFGQDADLLAKQITGYLLKINLPPLPKFPPYAPLENETVSTNEMNGLSGTYLIKLTPDTRVPAISYRYYQRTIRIFSDMNSLQFQELGELPDQLLKQKNGTYRIKGDPYYEISFTMENGKATKINIEQRVQRMKATGDRIGDGDVKTFHEALLK